VSRSIVLPVFSAREFSHSAARRHHPFWFPPAASDWRLPLAEYRQALRCRTGTDFYALKWSSVCYLGTAGTPAVWSAMLSHNRQLSAKPVGQCHIAIAHAILVICDMHVTH
jgi:hypothetical protein